MDLEVHFIKQGVCFEKVDEASKNENASLSPAMLFDLLDRVIVRRTRRSVQVSYPNEVVPINGVDHLIRFPEPVVIPVKYEATSSQRELLSKLAAYLTPTDENGVPNPDATRLSRYSPENYKVTDTDAELKRYQNSATGSFDVVKSVASGDASIFESSGELAMTAEEYRHQMLAVIRDNKKQDLVALPPGAFSFKEFPAVGYVFCARVSSGDKSQVILRTVAEENDGTRHIEGNALNCLHTAYCEESDKVASGKYTNLLLRSVDVHWARAKDDIVRSWNEQANPAFHSKQIKKPLRDAKMFLQHYSPSKIGDDMSRLDKFLELVLKPYNLHVVREVNAILKSDTPEQKQADLLFELFSSIPTQHFSTPKRISSNDVELIVWLGLTPSSLAQSSAV